MQSAQFVVYCMCIYRLPTLHVTKPTAAISACLPGISSDRFTRHNCGVEELMAAEQPVNQPQAVTATATGGQPRVAAAALLLY
jgi:hypothetical protein